MTDESAAVRDGASYRDPSGTVLHADGRVFRTVAAPAWEAFDAARASGLLDRLTSEGTVVRSWVPDPADVPQALRPLLAQPGWHLIEHEPVPFISYPYEWPFSLLKRAALHHLDLQIRLLESGFTLSDASAYNVQFRGTRPVFIDLLSLVRYVPGAYWAGYRQFCEQFLNPLLLGAVNGVAHHGWYRGALEGIAVEDLARVLPVRARWSWRTQVHVLMHARLTQRARRDASSGAGPQRPPGRPLTKAALVWMLSGLRTWIAGLRPKGTRETVWADYADHTSYTPAEGDAKRDFVRRYASAHPGATVFDLGCNTGDYAEAALGAGVARVIGFDLDLGALEAAVARSTARGLDFLPLYGDAANPSPTQGWAQGERRGLGDRANAGGVLALALLHHLAIGRNVPLTNAVDWVTSLAPSGVLEFVPKPDPMVQRMLANREDIFPDYSEESCRRALRARHRIVRAEVVSGSGRVLFEYRR